MYPESSPLQTLRAFPAVNKQQGFLLPLAVFILIIMGAFALVLSRNTIQSNSSATLEMMTVQAFYAAESGSYRGMQTLFFPASGSRNGIDTRCAAMNVTHNFSVTGLKNCSAVVTCSCLYADNTTCDASTAANYSSSAATLKLTSFYKLSSLATCGVGNLRSVRTVDAGAMMKQE
ncbi:MAG TPA: MSHA biogenesis protein MshP [Cellvibrio sp.]|nr:MSHA biogenesis protein MshP [Cellvibrio sp.]